MNGMKPAKETMSIKTRRRIRHTIIKVRNIEDRRVKTLVKSTKQSLTKTRELTRLLPGNHFFSRTTVINLTQTLKSMQSGVTGQINNIVGNILNLLRPLVRSSPAKIKKNNI